MLSGNPFMLAIVIGVGLWVLLISMSELLERAPAADAAVLHPLDSTT